MYPPPSVVGYRKEQIKVQIDKSGNLKINGERPLEGNRWSRFHKEFQVPENCNVSDIKAKFENGRLYVILPKLITEVKGQEQPQKPKESQKPAIESKPSTGQDDMNQKESVKPNGVTKKQEDEKRGEQVDARKDVQKVGKKEKDQTEEKKYNEKVTGAVKHEEGKKGDAVPDVKKKEEVLEKKYNEKVSGAVKHEEGEKGDAVPAVKKKEEVLEKKYNEKVTGAVKHEEDEKGDAVPDVKKKEVLETGATGNGRNGERTLKHKLDELGLSFDKQKQIMVKGIVAAVLLVGLGLYMTHKLRPMEEGGH